jgi:hypothetical protein
MKQNVLMFGILSFSAFAIVLSGCSNSTSSSPGNSNPLPGAGSTFTYTYTSVDTNGVTSAPSDSTYTILGDSLTYQGKTNVLEVQDEHGGISYYHLEANGDISIYLDLSSFPLPVTLSTNWLVLPIGSSLEQKNVLFDSTIMFPYNGTNTAVDVSVQTDAKDMGPATISAANNSFASEKGAVIVTASASIFGGFVQLASLTETISIWYSKQLKYYPERQDKQVIGGLLLGNSKTTSDTYLLNSYTLK